jgi:hypothetical protein
MPHETPKKKRAEMIKFIEAMKVLMSYVKFMINKMLYEGCHCVTFGRKVEALSNQKLGSSSIHSQSSETRNFIVLASTFSHFDCGF